MLMMMAMVMKIRIRSIYQDHDKLSHDKHMPTLLARTKKLRRQNSCNVDPDAFVDASLVTLQAVFKKQIDVFVEEGLDFVLCEVTSSLLSKKFIHLHAIASPSSYS